LSIELQCKDRFARGALHWCSVRGPQPSAAWGFSCLPQAQRTSRAKPGPHTKCSSRPAGSALEAEGRSLTPTHLSAKV